MSITEINLTTQAQDATLKPSKISTSPADNFVFPNNVTATATLLTPLIATTGATNVIDINNSRLLSGGLFSTDWLNRILYASDGSTQNLTWATPGTVSVNAILDVTGHSIIHVATPVNAGDAASKSYVDSTSQGLAVKSSCTAATTAALPAVTASGHGPGKSLTENANGLLTVDGISTWTDVVHDGGSSNPTAALPASRVLIKNQANPVDNGIYYVQDKGSPSTPFIIIRAPDFDGDGSDDNDVVPGCFTFVGEGTVNASSGWVLTTPATDHVVNITTVVGDGHTVDVTTNAGASVGGSLTQGATTSSVTAVPPYGTTITLTSNSGFTTGNATATPAVIVIDVDSITWSQFSGAGQIIAGNGLTKTGNELDVHPSDTSLTVSVGNINVTRDPAGAVGLTASGLFINTDNRNIGISANTITLLNPIKDTGNVNSVDWQNRRLYDASGNNSVLWASRILPDEAGNLAISYSVSNGRYLADHLALTSINWDARTMYATDGGSIIVNWGTQILNDFVAGNPHLSLDWTNRLLYGSDGATVGLNWNTVGQINLPGSSLIVTKTGGTGILVTAADFTGLTGPNVTVTSGTSGSAGGTTSGGSVTLKSGDGNGASSHLNGASLTLTTGTLLGDTGFATGGSITLTTGNENGGGGGGTLVGGGITLTTGSPGSGGTATGGSITLTASSPATGGNLSLTGTGASHGTITAGGNMAIDGTTFNVDSVNHLVGIGTSTPSSIGGLLTIFGTSAQSVILSGASGSSVNLTAPGITLTSGALGGGGSHSTVGGSILLTSGVASGTTNVGGSITLTSGSGFANQGGAITMTSGAVAGGGSATGGNLTLTCGDASGPTSDNIGGSIILTTGNITGSGSGHATRGGSITLTSGSYSTGGATIGGGITLTSGAASGGGGQSTGGSILLTSGGGGSQPDSGGNITLTSATAANGGSLVLFGTGANGTPGSPAHGNIYANNLDISKIYTTGQVLAVDINNQNLIASDGATTQLNWTTAGTVTICGATNTFHSYGFVTTGEVVTPTVYGNNSGSSLQLAPFSADSTNAIRLTGTSSGNIVLRVDTSNNRVGINSNNVSSPAPQFTLDVNGTMGMNSNRIQNVADPTAAQDAATKNYVDTHTLETVVTTVTTTTTITTAFQVYLSDATGGAFTVTLPSAASSTNHAYTVKKIDSTANAVTLQGNGTDVIDGSNTQLLNSQWQSYTVVSNGTSWYII